MATENEIKEFKDYITKDRHTSRIAKQREDQSFFEDDFAIPHLGKTDPKKANYEVRTGFVAEMANGFTEQLIAPIPKVYVEPKVIQGRMSKEREDAADRIASLGNKWCYTLGKQTHNPFKQTFKYLAFTRGEAWIYIPHRPDLAEWEGRWQEEHPDLIPVYFVIYDPLVVFHEPTEDMEGQPTRVVVHYKKIGADIKGSYPHWTKYNSDRPGEEFDFWMYVDKNTIYAEAGDEPLFRDIQGNLVEGDGRRINLYGCVPAAHVYSGWGSESQNKSPELLAYSRTRMLKGRVKEDASMAADMAYNIHATAWRHRTLINKSGQELGKDTFKEYHPNEPGKLSVLTLPGQADIVVEETQVFETPVFAYRDRVKADLAMAYPAPLRGIASGTSGRQEDILAGAGLSFYDSPVENNSTLWENAFEKALKICTELPDMLPVGLEKEDIKKYSEIVINTRREDPLESSRKATDGDRKYQLGIIDAETNLIDYQGKTKAEAKRIRAKNRVEEVLRNDPILRTLLAMRIARELDMEDEYKMLAEQEGATSGINPMPNYGERGGAPREGNIQTPAGREMPDMSAERRPPRQSGRY